MNGFGYANAYFIGADADRISPEPEDFSTSRLHIVPDDIKSTANGVLSTTKFDGLRKVNVTRGQNEAFVLRAGTNYVSEKNFSLGELCLIKLIAKIRSAPAQSLIVIDELEMALHPSAQVRLYDYLRKLAKEKAHTVIFSTHSVSLIKTASRNRIIFLRKVQGEIYIEKGPYISDVLGGIALVEARSVDNVIYVEDQMAELSARTIVKLVLADRLHKGALLQKSGA